MEPPADRPPNGPAEPVDEPTADDPVAAVDARQGRRSTVVDFLTSVADLLNPWT